MTELVNFHADPTYAPVALLLVALASARLTRLVVRDKITEPAVSAVTQWFHDRAERRLNLVELPDHGWRLDHRTRRRVRSARRADALARFVEDLTSCGWCTSVWTSALLGVGWLAFTPSTWFPLVVAVLAAAEVAGQLRRRDVG